MEKKQILSSESIYDLYPEDLMIEIRQILATQAKTANTYINKPP